MGTNAAFDNRSSSLRVLLVADTHIGFDLPLRPRVERRRRGHDFVANFQRALQPALRGEVDLVLHGGDLFDRSRVPPALVELAMEPLVRVAETGTPVYVVPGNHERARIPLHLWSAHPNLHIFHEPRSFLHRGPGGSVALVGFPFARRIRDRFAELLRKASAGIPSADYTLLCMHQTVEGSQVGPGDFTFRRGRDIIPGRDLPAGFDAVLSGHIHRPQMLTQDLAARRLAAPVIYPGSVERTSFAERDEDKGYAVVTLGPPGEPIQVDFCSLPARPMVSLVLDPPVPDRAVLERLLISQLREIDPQAIVRVQLCGPNAGASEEALTAACLRDLAPSTMNIDLARNSFNRPRQAAAFRV
jgi:DNA repair exonuclease SbcCD nuclease subunit